MGGGFGTTMKLSPSERGVNTASQFLKENSGIFNEPCRRDTFQLKQPQTGGD